MEVEGLIIALVGVVLLRLAIGLYLIGVARSKNVASLALRLLLETCIGLLAFWAVGRALLTLDLGVLFDLNHTFGMEGLFAGLLLITASTVATAAVMERSTLALSIIVCLLLNGLVLPLTLAASNYLFSNLPIDQVIAHGGHAPGLFLAFSAVGLLISWFVGPRSGKFNHDGSSNVILGHNIPLCFVGVILFLIAWPMIGADFIQVGVRSNLQGYGSIPQILYQVALTPPFLPLLAAAAAGCSGAIYSWIRYARTDVALVFASVLAGAVAATLLSQQWSGYAVIAGLLAGVLTPFVTNFIEFRLHIDDPSSLISIFSIGAVLSGLSTLLPHEAASAGFLSHSWQELEISLLIVVIPTAMMALALIPLHALKLLRISEVAEYDGLDLTDHDLNAYPDFHQSMIKSYHLREL